MADLIGLGEAMVEIYADQPLGSATQLQKSFGGDVLNALVMAQRLSTSTGFYTRVGNDPFGQGLLEFCQSEGLDTSQAKLVGGENGVYFISLQANGEREFSYRRKGSAASQYSPADLDPNSFRGGKMLLVSGISQAISVSCQEAVFRAAQMAKEHGLEVAFDPNYRPKLWESQGGLVAAQAAYQKLEPLIDVLLPSYPADLAVLGLEPDQPEKALNQLKAKIVAIKCGEDGAWISTQGVKQHLPAQPTQVQDTTGAGDAWNGAFLHGLLAATDPLEAARQANQMAARKLGYRGAIPPRQAIKEQYKTRR